MKKSVLISLSAFLFLCWQGQAFAEDVWSTRCTEAIEQECEMFQRLSALETGQRVVEMAIGFPKDHENGRGVVVLPLGILLTNGARLQIDDEGSFSFDVRFCTQEGCFAFLSLNESILELMKKGNEATIHFMTLNQQNVEVSLSLVGFTKALNAIRP